jgi:anti-sigma factor RsiW
MAADHPETELAPYLYGGLSADERDQVARHLERCTQCRESVASSAAIFAQLSDAIKGVPEPDWIRYRAELRSKLRTVQDRHLGMLGRWRRPHPGVRVFGWPSIVIGTATVALLALVLVTHRGSGLQTPGVDQLQMQPEISDADIGLLANYRVVEHLDLLENYDEIEHLDELAPEDRQNHETSS